MNTYVAVNTYTYSITYMAEKIMISLKEVIRESGLDPIKLAGDWESTQNAVKTWLESHDLLAVHLEIYAPKSNTLVTRWDIDIAYDSRAGDGSMWVDTEDLWYAIRKAGYAPFNCDYDVILSTRPGRPYVHGWTSCTFRSTQGMKRHSIGTMINASNGLGARASYWSR